jgi:disease resistance protein RPM1
LDCQKLIARVNLIDKKHCTKMADAVSSALQELYKFVLEEWTLLARVDKYFNDIKDDLESIQALLNDADRITTDEGEGTNEGVKTWVKQLREADS